MTVQEAVAQFDRWEHPWEFERTIPELLRADPEQLSLAERIIEEANRREHWMAEDLALGCKLAQDGLKKAFPDVDDETLGQFVRAAAYNWR